jgi:acetyl esterase/lipase
MTPRTAGAFLVAALFALPAAIAAGDKSGEKPGKGDDVEIRKDLAYTSDKGADPERHKLDLYLPKAKKGFPVLVFVHGGGWTKGDRKAFAKQGETFARSGVGVASVGYRLSPGVKHPAHAQDVAKAFAWVHVNIAKYGGRADQLFVSGHSAGGHLAALVATDESYLKAEKLSLKDVRGAIPISGVYAIPAGKISAAFGTDPEGSKQASPLTYVKAGLPPFLVLYADKDSPGMEKGAEVFCAALKKAGDEATCMKIADRDHGSILRNAAGADDPVTQAMLQFIRKHAGTSGSEKK